VEFVCRHRIETEVQIDVSRGIQSAPGSMRYRVIAPRDGLWRGWRHARRAWTPSLTSFLVRRVECRFATPLELLGNVLLDGQRARG
jgi:hypothetical protein